jgi:hypothetical protein
MSVRILAASENSTIQFAKRELARYIDAINGGTDTQSTVEIKIGVFSEFFPERDCKASPFDDEIYIDIRAGSGIVAGINPRSCLLAAYRLLREAGCRFLRPGENGEFIPKRDWREVSADVDEKPSYRHRGICIEGAVSRELYLDMIDWLPKNGMNAYFVQFRCGHTFFERWYAHKHNPSMKPEFKTAEEIRCIVEEGIKAVQLRDMIYHEVGHGWTCEPLGIPGFGWDEVTDVPAGAADAFALVNGRRELWGGIPLNTNLCYGNRENRELITESIVSYLQQNPNVDILHFWLADASNNHCECELCAGTRPSDFYVMMLNRLDERLSELGIGTKIVFLIYYDLLWLPEKQRIQNPDRFILMFAPITRTYSRAFSTANALPDLPDYVRNRLSFPSTVEGNIAFLKAWQTFFTGDSFDFDYHLLWDQFKEPTYEDLTRVLWEDIRNLRDIGLNGLMSCQVQRSFFPTPLPMQALAQTLWNRETDYGGLAGELYSAAYGKDGPQVHSALQNLSALFNPKFLRMEEPANAAEARQLAGVAAITRALRELIAAQAPETGNCRKESWRLLGLYCTYAEKFAIFCIELHRGNAADARKALDELIGWAFSEEENLGYAFDCDTMRYTLEELYKRMAADLER